MLPGDVLEAAERLVGRPHDVQPLGGLSGVSVASVRGPQATVVVKGPVGVAERHVSVDLAPRLAAAGVRVARAVGVVEVVDQVWLLLEHLPRALPRERWGADPEVLAVLRRLHALEPALVSDVPDRHVPRWDDAQTAHAARVLRLPATTLGRLQLRAQRLFDPVGVVSADPNPLNWRLDDAGEPVLLDQGRLTLGRPEIDLAVVLPGLPTPAEARGVVAAYGAGDPLLVLLAKLWTLVELTGEPGAAGVVAATAPHAPDWVAGWSDQP